MKQKSLVKSLGLSISMHDETLEAIRAIESFLKFHPDSEVKLWGNREAELKEVGSSFGLIVTSSPQYVNKLMQLLHSKTEKSPAEAAEILREFLQCALQIYSEMNCDYVVYLHPDHLVVRKFRKSHLKHDLELHKVNKYSSKQKEAWFSITGRPLSLNSYGLAGYFRRSSLIAAINLLLNKELINLELLMESDLDFIFEDLIIPCAFDYLGFEVKDQNLTQEIRRRKRLSSYFRSPVLLHQVERIG